MRLHWKEEHMSTLRPAKVRKTKYGTYLVEYFSPDNRRRRVSAGDDEQIARRMAVRFTDWLMEGKDPEKEIDRARQAEQARLVTLRDFYPVFMDRHGRYQSQPMQELYSIFFRNIDRLSSISDVPMADITGGMVSDYMDNRINTDGVKPATVNREASFIRCVLNLALRRNIIIKNPLQGFKMLRENNKRELQVPPDRVLALLEHLPGSVANIVEFAIYTGFRLKNILTLKLSQVRIHESDETGEVDLYVKGGRWETKPLKLEAIAVIRRAMVGRQEGYVFISPKSGTRYTTVRKTFNRAVRKLELKTIAGDPLCFHDLRRIFATWLQEGGAGIQDINYFLGHRSLATTQRYITIDHKVMGQRLNALPSLRKSTG